MAGPEVSIPKRVQNHCFNFKFPVPNNNMIGYHRTTRKIKENNEKSEAPQEIEVTRENNNTKKIKISDSTTIVISKSVWKDKDRLDIRTYIETEKYSGPTKKGINVDIEKIDEIITALKEIKYEFNQNRNLD